MILMIIALVLMKMSPINMSIFVECIGFVSTPNRADRYCKKHKYLETKLLQERLDECAENLNYLGHTCELCNEHDHFSTQCKMFHEV